MLPLEPGDEIDTTLSGPGTHPNKDETANNDGWAAFSGTSAAAPQLAGIFALIKQACPRLTPVQVRNILKNTARDVTAGNSRTMIPDYPTGNKALAMDFLTRRLRFFLCRSDRFSGQIIMVKRRYSE